MEKHEQDTQDCLAIEEDKAALTCLKKVVRQYSGSAVCRPKLVLLVKDGCIPCKGETALHKDDISKGIVEKIVIDSPRGRAIAERNDIYAVPSLLLLDCQDNLIMPESG